MKSPVDILHKLIPSSETGQAIALSAAMAVMVAAPVVFAPDAKRAPVKVDDTDEPDVTLATLNAVGQDGPVLVEPRVSRGVNCEQGTNVYVVGEPIYTRSDVLRFRPTDEAETGYVGLDKGVVASYGYYPLVGGWAVRQSSEQGSYDVYSFKLSDYQPRESNPDVGTAELVGTKLESFTVAGLAIRGGTGWTDGMTTMSVSLETGLETGMTPTFDVGIQCAEYVAPRRLDQ